jgi:hypothetical protein
MLELGQFLMPIELAWPSPEKIWGCTKGVS